MSEIDKDINVPNKNDLISRQAALDALKRTEALSRAFGYHVVIDAVEALPSVDAVPVEWIRDEIDWLKKSDNLFAKLGAGQLEAMLKRWKDGDEHG